MAAGRTDPILGAHMPTSAPRISLVQQDDEVTLLIDGIQAMQGWERGLMHRSADLLCSGGGDFLEVGLGLGYSALRIAGSAGTRSHRVVEMHQEVVDLFRERHPDPPPNLTIVEADFMDVVPTLEPGSLDGIFFDPELPRDRFEDRAWLDGFMPALAGSLRPGGRFVPMFALDGAVPDAATCTTSAGAMVERYLPYFDEVHVEKCGYTAYASTRYTPARQGRGVILCFATATPGDR